MPTPITPTAIYPALQALLGLPNMCTRFELRVAYDDLVTVSCEYYVGLDGAGIQQLSKVLAAYELVARADVAQPHPAEVMGFDAWMHARTDRAHADYMARTAQLPA